MKNINKLLEKIKEEKNSLNLVWNSGYSSCTSDYYSCPCCQEETKVEYVKSNKLIDFKHHEDCLYLLLNELEEELKQPKIKRILDIISNKFEENN